MNNKIMHLLIILLILLHQHSLTLPLGNNLTKITRIQNSELNSTKQTLRKISTTIKDNSTIGIASFNYIKTTQDNRLERLEQQNASTNQDSIDKNCGSAKKLNAQPTWSELSILRKCCPIGESVFYNKETHTETCEVNNKPFKPEIIDATFYENCIDANENKFQLTTYIGNPCKAAYIAGRNDGDVLYVLQNGSLLLIDEFGNQDYIVVDEYCLDVDIETGTTYAIICDAPKIGRAQAILFASVMIVSIPCSILVGYLHFSIKKLRTLPGLCHGCLAISLTIGFLLLSMDQFMESHSSVLGYAIQFFMLSYFIWLMEICFNIALFVWIFLRRSVELSLSTYYSLFIGYLVIALVLPLFFVILSYCLKFPGLSFYFYKGWTESMQASQKFFILSVSSILSTSIVFLAIGFCGFWKVDEIFEYRRCVVFLQNMRVAYNTTDNLPELNVAMYKETKLDFKCITAILIVVSFIWIFEVRSFYSPGLKDYFAALEIVNGLQGVIILTIHFGIHSRRRTILESWKISANTSSADLHSHDGDLPVL